MQKFKRTVAFLTAVAMTFSLFPTAVLASNEQGLEASSLTEDYIYSEGLSSQYLTASESLIETEGFVEADGLVGGYEASEYSEDYYITQTTLSEPTIDSFKVEPITYKIASDDSVQILNCAKDVEGEIIIPETVTNEETGKTYNVVGVGKGAFSLCKSIEKIELPSSLEFIEGAAFLGCDDITEITLPENVTSIGSFAFQGCKELEKITLPKNLESMGEQIFYNCGSLASVEIPDSVTSMGIGMFAECRGLTKVKLPENNVLTEIPANTFQGCSSLTSIGSVDSDASVEIPDSVTTIGDVAFFGCTSLKKAWIPDSVTSMGKGVFAECSALNDVRLSASLTKLPDNTFQDCDSIKSVGYYNVDNPSENVDNPSEYIVADVQLPNTMTTIGQGAFWCCNKQPEDQDGQPEVDGYVDTENYGLESVVLPENIQKIDSHAFFNCKYLTQIDLSNGLTSIGTYAFAVSGLTELKLPDGIKTIGSSAFESCEKLQTVNFPNSITNIGKSAFRGCFDLTSANLSQTNITLIAQQMFSGCIRLEEVILPDTVTQIYVAAFENCKNLEEIVLPANVTKIGTFAFSECTNLKDVTIKNNIPPTLYQDANQDQTFSNCSSELEIHIPVNTKADYQESMWNIYNLKGSCYISGTVTDESGNPIPNVSVTICDETENEMVTEYTDSNGQYTTYNMALEDGNYTFKFSKEGYTEKTEVITADGVNIEDANFVLSEYKIYTVTEGAGSAYEKGSAEGLKFVCDADYTKFKEITVDGTVVDNSNYTTESGSTIITFKSSYLETLNSGTHTLSVNFEDGYAETNFTINEASTNDPSTDGNETGGDTTNGDSSTNNDATNNNNSTNSNPTTDITVNGDSNLSIANETPQTGDNSLITLCFVFIGAAILSVVAFKRKGNTK